MKYFVFTFIIHLGVGYFVGLSGQEQGSLSADNKNRYAVDASQYHQSIDHFGASDAWSIQYIGLWPEEKQQRMATWLFSTENDEEGNPNGIGLSLWRFYFGAGSKEQGNESKISNQGRRAECFLLPDGTYDWEKQKGQRNFLRLAKQQGVNQFLGFIYSPPVYWTQNGLATNLGRGGTFNLKADKYDDYASYIADLVQGIESHEGIFLNYFSPFNEPDGHWNWDGSSQEGTAATKYEIAKATGLISAKFKERGISTKIIIPESSDYHCMISTHPQSGYDRGYQIQSYFSKDSMDTFVGDLPNVPNLLAAHSYWTNTPLSGLRDIRKEMGELTEKHKVSLWMTELCVMNNDEEIGGGHGKDLTMKTALYIARIIHHDLVYANASAWSWWLAVSTGDYKDGLIYADPVEDEMDGTFSDSKLMWTLGNYSRFIRPGAKRISVTALDSLGTKIPEGETDPKGLMISAYKNIDHSLVLVIINYSTEDELVDLNIERAKVKEWSPFITSDEVGFNLKKQTNIKYGNKIKIPSKSVVTLVSNK